MNKFYDKLLAALAFLALLAGLGFFFLKSGEQPSTQVQISTQPADNPYQDLPVPESEDVEASWPVVEPQSSGWRYDVFTPPEIYIGEDGGFTIVPWSIEDEVEAPIPFGVYLASLSRDPYRIQMEGYIEEDRSDASKSLVLFVNEETDQTVRARIGDTREASEFTLLDFSIDRIRDEDGNISRIAKATIRDLRSGEEITLIEGERRFESTVTVVIRSDQHPEFEAVLSEAGTPFETPEAAYILEAIQLEDASVTVQKLANEELELEAETRVLQVREARQARTSASDASAPASRATPEADASPAASPFDFNF